MAGVPVDWHIEKAPAGTRFTLYDRRTDVEGRARAQVEFLRSFEGVVPAQVSEADLARLHTVPFRLVNDKVMVQAKINGGPAQDFVLDTGSEATVVSREVAQARGVKPVTYTLSAGVGEVGLRGLQLARVNRLEIGTLTVRNLPVLIKNPALRGIPKREGESFSPLSLGMSMVIDYQKRLLSIGRIAEVSASAMRLPMRIHRLAMVRGTLNATRPTYFVVDTGGEVISISADTAGARLSPPARRRRRGEFDFTACRRCRESARTACGEKF